MKEIYEKLGLFYLGKDSSEDIPTLYKSKHLTTHAAIIGMTGSGKTGLGISLIEEAAIDNIPSIIIDPKGDMGNLCLAFPKMQAEDFEPWIEQNQDAEKLANSWKNGLENSAQDLERVQKFANVKKSIYTPGSSAGISVNVLGSFDAPSAETLQDSDTFSSLINATVSSLLALIGEDGDSLNSKESLLLSNILHHFWKKEISLSLEELIGHVASPPFEKLGVLPLSSFYPQKDRMKLAQLLNGIISSVTFASWLKGEPLDIQNMLYDEDGKAKVAIFSISHLNDEQRMFFVTILLNAYVSWMRRQRGSSTLKAILYMDEIFGFFPPSKNPPSKEPMLLLLKQARAFGVGVVLSTQNPVDIDYKGLSNIGTWFIGKLQTKQDIEKVLDGISAKSNLSKKEIAHKISTLKGRDFFLKNVHEERTQEFSTRWVLSYLKGPMTKNDIRLIMDSQKKRREETPKEVKIKKSQKLVQKQMLTNSIKEYYLDNSPDSNTPFYPLFYTEVSVRFFSAKRSIDIQKNLFFKLEIEETQKNLNFEHAYEEELLSKKTKTNIKATYSSLPQMILQAKSDTAFKKNLSNFLYATKRLELFVCKSLKMESKPHQSRRDFLVDVESELKERKELTIDKLKDKFQTKYDRLEDKHQTLQMRLQKEQSDVTAKTTDTILSVGLAIFSAFFGRKSSSISKGATAVKKGQSVFKEKNDVKNVNLKIENVEEDIIDLKEKLEEEIDTIQKMFSVQNHAIESLYIKPRRVDIVIKDFALLWQR